MATTKKMIRQALQKRCTRRRRSRNCECSFLIHNSEKYANTYMAVFIRRVTCKSLLSFWGEIYLPGLRPCFLHGGAIVLFSTATKSATFLKNFQVNLHLTHKKRATCFATLLQNELNVTRFTTHVQTC